MVMVASSRPRRRSYDDDDDDGSDGGPVTAPQESVDVMVAIAGRDMRNAAAGRTSTRSDAVDLGRRATPRPPLTAGDQTIEAPGPCLCYRGLGRLAGTTVCHRSGCVNTEHGPRATVVACEEEDEGTTMRTDSKHARNDGALYDNLAHALQNGEIDDGALVDLAGLCAFAIASRKNHAEGKPPPAMPTSTPPAPGAPPSIDHAPDVLAMLERESDQALDTFARMVNDERAARASRAGRTDYDDVKASAADIGRIKSAIRAKLQGEEVTDRELDSLADAFKFSGPKAVATFAEHDMRRKLKEIRDARAHNEATGGGAMGSDLEGRTDANEEIITRARATRDHNAANAWRSGGRA
jgi:hypothetical protein